MEVTGCVGGLRDADGSAGGATLRALSSLFCLRQILFSPTQSGSPSFLRLFKVQPHSSGGTDSLFGVRQDGQLRLHDVPTPRECHFEFKQAIAHSRLLLKGSRGMVLLDMDRECRTALHCAAQAGAKQAVELLLKAAAEQLRSHFEVILKS